MNSKVKSNSVVTHSIEGGAIKFTVRDAGEFTLDVTALHADIRARAAIHGLVQRISDKAALGFNKEANRYATPAEKFAAMKALADHYTSGSAEWSVRAAGERDTSGLTIQAIANVKGVDAAAARAMVERLAEKAGKEVKTILAELRNAEKVGAEIARIKAANAPATDISLDDLN